MKFESILTVVLIFVGVANLLLCVALNENFYGWIYGTIGWIFVLWEEIGRKK